MSKLVAIAAAASVVIGTTAISQALANPGGGAARTSLSQQIGTLSRQVKRDGRAIASLAAEVQVLQERHLTVTIRTDGNSFGANGAQAGQALCTANETVVGGGVGWGDNGGANVNDRLLVSQPSTYPNGSGAGWIGVGIPGTDELQPFQVYALCAS
jgi:hypothetical protein